MSQTVAPNRVIRLWDRDFNLVCDISDDALAADGSFPIDHPAAKWLLGQGKDCVACLTMDEASQRISGRLWSYTVNKYDGLVRMATTFGTWPPKSVDMSKIETFTLAP